MYVDGRLIQPLRAHLDDFAVYPGALTGEEFASAAANAPCARKFTGDGYVYFGDTPESLLENGNGLPRPFHPNGPSEKWKNGEDRRRLNDYLGRERRLPGDKQWDVILDRVSLYSKSVKISGRDWMDEDTEGTQQESLAPVCTSGKA